MLIVVEAPSTLLRLYVTGVRPPLLSAQHPLNYSAAAFNSAASASSQYLHHPHHPPTATTFSLRKKKPIRASPVVLSMRPCKDTSHIQALVIYLFPTPTIKLKLGLQIGGRVLLPNHQNQSLSLADQKQGTAVRSYLFVLFSRGLRLYCAFHWPQHSLPNMLCQNHFAEPNRHVLAWRHPNSSHP